MATQEGEDVYSNLDNLTTEFAMYTNFGSSLSHEKCAADGDRISAFYLMTVFTRYLDLPQTSYMNFLSQCMESLPVVSAQQQVVRGDEETAAALRDELVLLSYDRLMGERYSSQQMAKDSRWMGTYALGKSDNSQSSD